MGRQYRTEKRKGEMNPTDTVDLVTESGLMAEEVGEGLGRCAEGRVEDDRCTKEEGVELAVAGLLAYD